MKRFSLGLGVSFVFLLILELGVRGCWNPPNLYQNLDVGMQLQPHFTRIWSLKPGVEQQFGVQITIDSDGFRQSTSDVGSSKWLLLGDSSFFGHGLSDENTLHERLQAQLKRQEYSVHVRCGGVPGYSILQTQRLMQEVGWGLKPELLLIGNLWSDNNFDHFVDKDWLAALEPPSLFHQLLWDSRIFGWLQYRLRPPAVGKKGDPHRKVSWIREPLAKGTRRVDVQTYMQTLDQLITEAGKRSIGVVLIQPANRYRVEGSVPNATWDPYFEAQRAVASHRGVPIFDAAAYLRVFGVSAQEAFLDELHPSAMANELLAQGIILTLQASGWPDNLPLPSIEPSPIKHVIADPWSKGADFTTNTGQDHAPPKP